MFRCAAANKFGTNLIFKDLMSRSGAVLLGSGLIGASEFIMELCLVLRLVKPG